jgi:fructose-bisphosphate aldolase class II
MVNYKDLGLVNTREMFARAIKGGYAIPAFNFNNMEQMQAIIKAAVETKSPVILQVSKGARQYANATLLRYMAQGAVEYAKELGCKHLCQLADIPRQTLIFQLSSRFTSANITGIAA